MVEYTERRLRSKSGWLSPKGYYVPCEWTKHNWMAAKLQGKLYNPTEYWHTEETELELLSWIKISLGRVLFGRHLRIDDTLVVTIEQYNFLKIFFDYHKEGDLTSLDIRIAGRPKIKNEKVHILCKPPRRMILFRRG